jgi:tRNA-dihydrouridine synthase B
MAEASGVQALTVHGRTRACGFRGEAEYDTIAEVKAAVRIPVIANGDITTPAKAKAVLEHTRADGLMIGRAAQGRPWIFREVEHFLANGTHLPSPEVVEIARILHRHLLDLYDFYGDPVGVWVARKHIAWYTKGLPNSAAFRHRMMQLPSREAQLDATQHFFDELALQGRVLPGDSTSATQEAAAV